MFCRNTHCSSLARLSAFQTIQEVFIDLQSQFPTRELELDVNPSFTCFVIKEHSETILLFGISFRTCTRIAEANLSRKGALEIATLITPLTPDPLLAELQRLLQTIPSKHFARVEVRPTPAYLPL